MKLDVRETGALLAGLRLLQEALLDQNAPVPDRIWSIFTDEETMMPLDATEIDTLCEKINTSE